MGVVDLTSSSTPPIARVPKINLDTQGGSSLNSQTSPWALALLLSAATAFAVGCGDDGVPGDYPSDAGAPDAGLDGGAIL